jgi:hypothetical protein
LRRIRREIFGGDHELEHWPQPDRHYISFVRRVVLVLAAWAASLGCGEKVTGVHVRAHTTSLPYDELRFGVVLVPPLDSSEPTRTIVDPETKGRFQGPFTGGDQDVEIFLQDSIADQMINCVAMTLLAGAVTASGASEVVVEPQRVIDVDLYVLPPATSVNNGGPSANLNPGP